MLFPNSPVKSAPGIVSAIRSLQHWLYHRDPTGWSAAEVASAPPPCLISSASQCIRRVHASISGRCNPSILPFVAGPSVLVLHLRLPIVEKVRQDPQQDL